MWIVTLTIITALLLSNCYCFHIKMKAVSQLTWVYTSPSQCSQLETKQIFMSIFLSISVPLPRILIFKLCQIYPRESFCWLFTLLTHFALRFIAIPKSSHRTRKKKKRKRRKGKGNFYVWWNVNFARLKLSTVAPVSVVDIEQWRTLNLNLNRKLLLWCDEQQQ